MLLGRVMGNVVATAKYDSLSGNRMLIVQQVDGDDHPLGTPFIALDSVGAGTDEKVIIVQSKEASVPFGGGLIPVDATIVGIVDGVGR